MEKKMMDSEARLTPDQLQKFLQRGESDTAEFKTQVREPAILARIIAGFANNRGGTILIGVHELQGVVGTNTKLARSVFDAAMHWLRPTPEVAYHETEFDGKPIAVILVKASASLVFCRGQVFRRTGERTLPMEVSDISAKLAAPAAAVLPPPDIIAAALATLTQTVEKLRQELADANSFKSKLKDYLIGGVIGAVLGFLLSLILLIF
jgi:hypothetical protein